jgi:uncharacterized protein (DUF2141 family)
MNQLLRFLAVSVVLLPAAALGADLRVTVEGMRASTGTVLIGLYDGRTSFDRAIALSSKEGFLNDLERFAGAGLRAGRERSASFVFADLPRGDYAVILFHDENGNGKLDMNFWGVPTEPYGFSNDAQGFLGPPAIKDAMLSIDGGRTISIKLLFHEGSFVAERDKP